VADESQGHGIGTQLLGALSAFARAHGIETVEADVLGDNHQMIQVFRDSGFAIRQNLRAGVYHLTLDLKTTPAVVQRWPS